MGEEVIEITKDRCLIVRCPYCSGEMLLVRKADNASLYICLRCLKAWMCLRPEPVARALEPITQVTSTNYGWYSTCAGCGGSIFVWQLSTGESYE